VAVADFDEIRDRDERELVQRDVYERVKALVETIREERRYLLRISELDPHTTSYIVDHGVKTAIVAIATGMSLKLPPHRLIELGSVGMLHEIGMVRLPEQLYMGDRELTEREKRAISTHPVLGFKILRQQNFPMQLCLAVLECREHVDGSGYPRQLTNEKLSNYAKIISPASAYAAMASKRPYRPPIDGHTVMKTILTGQNTKYDREVLQGMVSTFSMFPYGTYVQLSAGHRAIVVDIVSGKARLPIVRVLTDGSGVPVREQPILETNEDQYKITGVLSPEEIHKLRTAI
jgi:HD-GYP domain-containing protein (c-di-GMP phosphodiesterase class II)